MALGDAILFGQALALSVQPRAARFAEDPLVQWLTLILTAYTVDSLRVGLCPVDCRRGVSHGGFVVGSGGGGFVVSSGGAAGSRATEGSGGSHHGGGGGCSWCGGGCNSGGFIVARSGGRAAGCSAVVLATPSAASGAPLCLAARGGTALCTTAPGVSAGCHGLRSAGSRLVSV